MFLNQLVNGIIQVVLFSLIPFLWWLITARKKENFFAWLGMKKPSVKGIWKLIIVTLSVIIGGLLLGMAAIWLRGPVEAADSQYKGMGAAAIPSILGYAFIQTAMSEEILFRGFLLKRLSAKFGFAVGNLVQAGIFGLSHLLMVWGQVGILAGTVIVVYPIIIAALLGYLNEKCSNGSILPSWAVHGTLNTISALMQAF